MPSIDPAIATDGLRKAYGDKVVLRDLTLTVQTGEIFGFLGPNGAGKTTTLKILAGLVRPTAGSVSILGQPPTRAATRQQLGYLPEQFRFHGWLTGEELLDFHGKLAGIPAKRRRERIAVALQRVGLGERGRDRLATYSKGMTQRIGIAQAIVHDPALVLLDEPTSALDPIGRREVRDLVRSLADEGVTVFINSHLLTEIEMVCDRVAIVDRGEVIRHGNLNELLGRVNEIRIQVDRIDAELLRILRTYGAARKADINEIALRVDSIEDAASIADEVVRGGYRLYGLIPAQQSLEELFVSLVESGDR